MPVYKIQFNKKVNLPRLPPINCIHLPVKVFDEEFITVTGYRSNSFLHWNKGYVIRNNKIEEVTGVFKVYPEPIITFRPTTWNNLGKPFPAEGKNVVTVSVEQFRELHKALLRLVFHLTKESRLLLVSTEDGCAIYIRYPPITAMAKEVAKQGNLHVFAIESIRTKRIKCNPKFLTALRIFNHAITTDEGGLYLISERETNRLSAYLLFSALANKIIIYSEDHEKIVIDIAELPKIDIEYDGIVSSYPVLLFIHPSPRPARFD